MATLLTGASGLLGANLAHLLCERGERPRVLVRPGSDRRGLRGLPVEEAPGDVLDSTSLDRAMAGVARVYHAAGVVRPAGAPEEAMIRVNVEGTRTVVAAARRAGVRRLVHVSSSATVQGGTLDAPGTEEQPAEGPPLSPYQRSKREAERAAAEAAGSAVELVICNPTLAFGQYDVRPSSGALLLAVARDLVRAYPSGGTNAVNAADVALGLWAAMERGRPGERYLLGGENLTWRELLTVAAEEAGVRPPRVPLPDAPLRALGRLLGAAARLPPLRARDPGLGAIAALAEPRYVSSAKAARELDYRPRPVRLGIRDALRWLQEEGALPRDQPLAPRGVLAR